MIYSIIFRFGEHYYQEPVNSFLVSLFIALIGSFLGILGALYVYRTSIKKDERNKLKKTQINFINRLKYFNLLIENIINNTNKQVDNYLRLAKTINESPYDYHLINLIAFNDITRIDQMDSEEIFRAYLYLFGEEDENIKDYKNIYSSIDFLDERLKQQINSQEKHISFIHKDQTIVKDLINGLSGDIETILFRRRREINDEETYINDSVVKNLNKFLNKYRSLVKEKAKLFQYETEFSKPLKESLLNDFKNYNFTDFLVNKSDKVAVLLEHIRFNSICYAKDVDRIKEQVKEPIEKLSERNKQIEKKIKEI